MRSVSLSTLVLLAYGCGSSSSDGGGPGSVAGGDASSLDAAPSAEASAGPDASRDAPADAPVDAGAIDSGSDEAEAAAAPTCGPPPNRFTLLTGADAGLVRDNVTERVWMRDSAGGQQTSQQTQTLAAAYCTGRGMRLPTKDEALALAAAYAPCAFGQWGTWTLTAVPGTGDAWVVDYLGDATPQLADNFPSAVLCVRDPAG
jgi:hypothetical protein